MSIEQNRLREMSRMLDEITDFLYSQVQYKPEEPGARAIVSYVDRRFEELKLRSDYNAAKALVEMVEDDHPDWVKK